MCGFQFLRSSVYHKSLKLFLFFSILPIPSYKVISHFANKDETDLQRGLLFAQVDCKVGNILFQLFASKSKLTEF